MQKLRITAWSVRAGAGIVAGTGTGAGAVRAGSLIATMLP
jgi:hypothetical protein